MILNPPERVLKSINQYLAMQPNRHVSSLEIWTKVLSDPEAPKGTLSTASLTARLIALTKQLDACEDLLKPKGVPDSLHSVQFEKLRTALSPTQVNGSWTRISEICTEDTLVVLRWASWAIGSLEEPIAADDLKELIRNLNELDTLIAEPGLPDSLKSLIQKNAREIREAIELYPIIGANGLRQAANSFFGEAFTQQDTLKAASESPDADTREAFEKLLETVKGVVDAFNASVTTHANLIKLGSWATALHLSFG